MGTDRPKSIITGQLLEHRTGGARRGRTADLLHAMQALYQLSYGPTREARNVKGGCRECQGKYGQKPLEQLAANPCPLPLGMLDRPPKALEDGLSPQNLKGDINRGRNSAS